MIGTMLVAAGVAAAAAQGADTTFPVPPTARLNLQLMRGEVVVTTWRRDEVRIVSEEDRGRDLQITAGAQAVRIQARSHRGYRDQTVALTIPATMPVEISGTFLEIEVDGAQSDVSLETVHGNVRLRGGRGTIRLQSVQGDVELADASGTLRVFATNGDVEIRNFDGPVSVEGTNGDVVLEQVRSSSVEATTLNGDVDYDGTVERGGRYLFTTHNGDLSIRVPERTGATVSVSTFNGDFESDFPVTLTETLRGGRKFTFTLNGGGASIELSSFGGSIRLLRPGARR
jgi:hypothetical protein